MKIVLRQILIACSIVLLLAVQSLANITTGFENWTGLNAEPVFDRVSGIVFSTEAGGDVYFADINTGWYDVTSDNGAVYETGEYFVSGNVAAYVADEADVAKISCKFGTATYFTLGYSTQYDLAMEAYNSEGVIVAEVFATPNTKSAGGNGLSTMTVNAQEISYVLLRGVGGFYMIDDISTDAAVPEPGALLTLSVGLVGLAARFKQR